MNKTPLIVHIVWHNEYETGLELARFLYSSLTRNVDDSLSRGIGIPIFFHTQKESSIDLSESIRNVIIVFINSSSIRDEEWSSYINTLNRKANDDELCLLIPVAISAQSFKIEGEIAQRNFIRLHIKKEVEEKKRYLLQMISNEICRFLFGANRLSDMALPQKQSFMPVKFFISHTKRDKVNIAKQINDFILSETPLKTFFDANDIRAGSYFSAEILENIRSEDSVMLVIQSDHYSSREWCRMEVIEAKMSNRPLVVLSRLEHGEKRSFPYMANVRTIKKGDSTVLLDPEEIEDIVVETLLETLKFKYQNLLIEYIVDEFTTGNTKHIVLSYPPELLSCMNFEENTIVFYPEPPLGEEEISILNKIGKSIRYITPSQIPLLSARPEDTNINVGLSISSGEDLPLYGITNIQLKDYFVEISRYLISSKFSISFGGDINCGGEDNFSKILVDLIHTYNKNSGVANSIITNYIASFLVDRISEEQEDEAFPYISYVKMKESSAEHFLPSDSRIRKALSLTNMRIMMNSNLDCRVSIGGKSRNFKANIWSLEEIRGNRG